MKNKKGITLVILVITIAILGLVATPIVMSVNRTIQYNQLTRMYEDIATLKEAIDFAFPIEDGDLVVEDLGRIVETHYLYNKNENDEKNGYILIDMQKLNNKLKSMSHKTIDTLNFGEVNFGRPSKYKSYLDEDNDIYVINKATRTIYYLRGIDISGDAIDNWNRGSIVMTDENNHTRSDITEIIP